MFEDFIKTLQIKEDDENTVGIYTVSDQGHTACHVKATEESFATYGERLVAAGYVLYTENQIGNNRFATYTKDDEAVHLAWYPTKSRCRIVGGPKGYLPSVTAPTYKRIVTPTLAQPKRNGARNRAAGLSLVTQLADGSFIIIDGGGYAEGDKESLLAYLMDNKPAEHEKPRITWMLTHVHSDHMDILNLFLEAYYDQVELETMCCNYPDFEKVTIEIEPADYCKVLLARLNETLATKYPNTNRYYFHAGDKLLLPGCEIEFIVTQEDFYPNGFRYVNLTSAAWKMTIDGSTLLVLGDCVDALCAWMADVYGSTLKSDILQVTHHGYNGATLDLYQLVDPKVCLWPAPEVYWRDISVNPYLNHPYNRYLLDNYDRHYHAEQDTVLILSDLSLKIN